MHELKVYIATQPNPVRLLDLMYVVFTEIPANLLATIELLLSYTLFSSCWKKSLKKLITIPEEVVLPKTLTENISNLQNTCFKESKAESSVYCPLQIIKTFLKKQFHVMS